jgi:hypothetical protein
MSEKTDTNGEQNETDTKTLILDAAEIARAHAENVRQSDARNVEMRVRWENEWEGEQHADVDWYDTSLQTRTHRRVKPAVFIDFSRKVYTPDKIEIMCEYADEYEIDASHPDEIRERGDENELEEWIEEAWDVFENQVRGAILKDEDRLKRFASELESVDEIRFE